MAKPNKGAERKRKVEDLPGRDVESTEAQTVTGGNVAVHDISITKYVDKSTPSL